MDSFIEYCRKGDINNAIKIYSLNENEIDIYIGNDKIFILSCCDGHIKIAT